MGARALNGRRIWNSEFGIPDSPYIILRVVWHAWRARWFRVASLIFPPGNRRFVNAISPYNTGMGYAGALIMTKFVRDAMHQGVVTCSIETPLRDALRTMSDNTVRSIVITDMDCSLTGILSQTDLVNVKLMHPESWSDMRVSDVMTRNVLTVTADAPLNEAAKTLIENHVHRIVVVDALDPCIAVGVLSMSDIVRDMMDDA
jgi:CBS domain-containing protein